MCARSRLARFCPPVKIGRVIVGAKLHVPVPLPKRSFEPVCSPCHRRRSAGCWGRRPRAPHRCWHSRARRACSALRMSGRCVSRSEGRPAGTSASSPSAFMSLAGGRSAGISCPSTSVSAWVSCASCRWYCARLARAASTALSAWRRLRSVVVSRSYIALVSSYDSISFCSVSCVSFTSASSASTAK